MNYCIVRLLMIYFRYSECRNSYTINIDLLLVFLHIFSSTAVEINMAGCRTRLQDTKIFLLSGVDDEERKLLANLIRDLGGMYIDTDVSQ